MTSQLINKNEKNQNLISMLQPISANAYAKKIPEHMSVVEGEKLKIHCKVFGAESEIMWTVGMLKIESHILCMEMFVFQRFNRLI